MVEYKVKLINDGIVSIPCPEVNDEALLRIASVFGKVVPGARGELVQKLPARDKGTGPKGSFSYTKGFGAFPWHTDTAYWDFPVRYLLLASEHASPCATLYKDFNMIRKDVPDFDYLMSRSVFLLNIAGEKRYLSPCVVVNGFRGYRMDFHICVPVNNEATILQERISLSLAANRERFVWTGKNIVIIDNLRMIHAREDTREDKQRVLKRIYINELV